MEEVAAGKALQACAHALSCPSYCCLSRPLWVAEDRLAVPLMSAAALQVMKRRFCFALDNVLAGVLG